MQGFVRRFLSIPESPLRLLASWFFCCGLFEILRPWFILYSWGFVLIALCVFFLLTLAQHLLPLPRFTSAALAVCTVFYAATLCATRITGSTMGVFVTVMIAVAVVLSPLLNREKGRLLPFRISRKLGIGFCIGAAIVFSVVIGSITCLRYVTFSSPNYDFGIFVNMFYNMRETGLPLVSCERDQILSHFAVHISPIYYLILPFFVIFPSPITLQVTQVVILASGIIPLYRLARHFRLSYGITALFAILYALYPAISTGCFYDLHENCFLVPLVLWLFVCYEEKRYGWLVLPACLILAVKEDAAVYLAFFALYILFDRRDWRRGLPLFAIAGLYFAIAIFLLQQFGTGAMFGRYDALLSDDKVTGGLLGTLLRDPAYFLEQITYGSGLSKKIVWLLQLALPLGVLLWIPRGKYTRLLLLFPLLLNLLTQYVYQFNIDFQYSFGTIPFLFYLLIQNSADSPPLFRRNHLIFATVTAGLLYTVLVLPKLTHYTTAYIQKHDTYTRMEEILDTVPDDVSVTASTVLIPHLADRLEIYEDAYHPDPDTDYVVLDYRSGFHKQSEAYLNKCLEKGYIVVNNPSDLIVILKAP